MSRPLRAVFAAGLVLAVCGCTSVQHRMRSSALEYLYPKGAEAAPPSDVRLTLPARVGIAFAPETATGPHAAMLSETQKQALLARVADAFREREGIASVEVIPATYLKPQGGFEDLDRVRSAFGVDLAALVSYDQLQFSESGKASIWYWTLLGAYVVKGERNQTRTVLDAAIFDIPSRAMLFTATGQHVSGGRATPIEIGRELREKREEGFERATDDLIVQLEGGLARFREQAATGTVRGLGTPAIAMVDEAGRPVGRGAGGGGAGALGPFDLALAAVLAGAALAGARGRRRRG